MSGYMLGSAGGKHLAALAACDRAGNAFEIPFRACAVLRRLTNPTESKKKQYPSMQMH